MRRILMLAAGLVVALALHAAKGVKGDVYAVGDVPNVHVADSRQYVSDPASLLSPSARDTINALFAALEAETGIETAVVMLPSIGDEPVFNFSQALFRKWGIGKKKSNNGLLVLYVADRRTIRFHTGYGIEGFLTDARGKRIQMDYMIPAFRRGDVSGGMVAGMAAVCKTLSGSMEAERGSDGRGGGSYLLLVAIVVFMIVVISAGTFGRHRCSHCRSRAVRRMSVDYYTDRAGRRMKKEVFVCDKCGHVTVRNRPADNQHNDGGSGMGSFLTGMLIGSLLNRGGGRYGGGGGGFGGGSFGGGDSGGGGSDSSW